MRKSLIILFAIASLVTFLQFCTSKKLVQISEDPISTLGHGAVLDKQGKEIQLNETLIKQVQDLYIRQLSDGKLSVREGSIFNEQEIRRVRSLIYSNVS